MIYVQTLLIANKLITLLSNPINTIFINNLELLTLWIIMLIWRAFNSYIYNTIEFHSVPIKNTQYFMILLIRGWRVGRLELLSLSIKKWTAYLVLIWENRLLESQNEKWKMNNKFWICYKLTNNIWHILNICLFK